MSSKKLARVPSVPAEVATTLRRHGILTCKDFLMRNCLELMSLLDFSYPQLQSLMIEVCKAVSPRPRRVLSMYRDRREKGSGFLATSLHKLDSTLHGGLPLSTVTEIAGPPGCGKTQFSLMLSIVAALPPSLGGLGRRVVYIDTEAAFTAERLVEMAKARYVEHFSSVENLVQLASSVHVFSETTCDGFTKRLETLDEVIVRHGVGLVVVDSIASLVRKEFDTRSSKGVVERASLLTKQASRLKYLADAFEIPVVVTNQITTRVSHDLERQSDWSDELNEDLQEDQSVVTAALGNSWSHCVNTRLLLQYMDRGRRLLTIAKSPVCDNEEFVVTIEEKGLLLDWVATAELNNRQLPTRGDPTSISLMVRSCTEGVALEFPGQYPGT